MYIQLLLVCALSDWQFVNGLEKGKSGKSDSRIVGGIDATQPYPYQVSIADPSLIGPGGIVYTWNHFCGGSIITERHILTAAHCVVDLDGNVTPADQLSILVGTHNLDNGGTRYSVCKSVYHPKYLSATFNYDIGIITVNDIITFIPRKVERIAYSKEFTEGNVSCVLTGWGSTGSYSNGPYPNNLQEVHVSTLSNEDCHNEYSFVTENDICALAYKGKGACDGDSGGPLVDINNHVQVGVIVDVSGGGCAIGEPDFYTRTSAFYDWIQEHTRVKSGECSINNSGNSSSQSNSGSPSNGNASNSGNGSNSSNSNPSNSGNSGNPFTVIYNWMKQKKP